MPSAIWTGAISFGLVQVPVRVVTATRSKDVSFNQLEESTGARIRYRKVSDVERRRGLGRPDRARLRDLQGQVRPRRGRRDPDAAAQGQPRDRDRGVRRPRRHRPAVLRAALLPRARRARREAVRAAGRSDDRDEQGRDRPHRDAFEGTARRDPPARRDALRLDDALLRRDRVAEGLVPDEAADIEIAERERLMAKQLIESLSSEAFDADEVPRRVPRAVARPDRAQGRRRRDRRRAGSGSAREGARPGGRARASLAKAATAKARHPASSAHAVAVEADDEDEEEDAPAAKPRKAAAKKAPAKKTAAKKAPAKKRTA